MKLLSLEHVSYRYKDTSNHVLEDVNIDFAPQKIYTIMGKSGAGKTTVLSLLAGLDTVTRGSIVYNGTDLAELNRDTYRAESIGVVFQGYNLLAGATALDNVILAMNISKSPVRDKKAYALELLEKVGINRETAHRKVTKLSGGEAQRVGIARALSHNPDVIIADEPTGNLDRDRTENIMRIFEQLAHLDGKCVIIVTHSSEVAAYADELWKLEGGHLVAADSGELCTDNDARNGSR